MPEHIVGWLYFALAGAAGALARACIGGFIELPKRKGNRLVLGFISDLILGIILGILVDQSFIVAFSAAFAGRQAMEDLFRNFIFRNPTSSGGKKRNFVHKIQNPPHNPPGCFR
ncbi:MAG: hypothetical protein QXV23_05215 [Candidatus Bathyarchaeia archaeon]